MKEEYFRRKTLVSVNGETILVSKNKAINHYGGALVVLRGT